MANCHFYPTVEHMIISIKPSPKPRIGNHSKISIRDPTAAIAQSSGMGSCVLPDACRRGTLQACGLRVFHAGYSFLPVRLSIQTYVDYGQRNHVNETRSARAKAVVEKAERPHPVALPASPH